MFKVGGRKKEGLAQYHLSRLGSSTAVTSQCFSGHFWQPKVHSTVFQDRLVPKIMVFPIVPRFPRQTEAVTRFSPGLLEQSPRASAGVYVLSDQVQIQTPHPEARTRLSGASTLTTCCKSLRPSLRDPNECYSRPPRLGSRTTHHLPHFQGCQSPSTHIQLTCFWIWVRPLKKEHL